jgi:vesicle coat complex subunit
MQQQTDDLEQKKLVYLYLMNYAKTQPELVILAVNTFVKVCSSLRSKADGRIQPTLIRW